MIQDKFLSSEKILTINTTAILGDLHFPTGCSDNCISRVLTTVPEEISQIIINGDLINSFPPSESAITFLEDLNSEFDSVVLHRGNHEDMVGGIESYIPEEISVSDFTQITQGNKEYAITHGHKLYTSLDLSQTNYIIIGHLHPATKNKTECAIQNSFQFNTKVNTTVIVMPAFGNGISNYPFTEHTKINDYISDIPSSKVIKTW